MISIGLVGIDFRSCSPFLSAICCHLGFVGHNNGVRVVMFVVVKVVGKLTLL